MIGYLYTPYSLANSTMAFTLAGLASSKKRPIAHDETAVFACRIDEFLDVIFHVLGVPSFNMEDDTLPMRQAFLPRVSLVFAMSVWSAIHMVLPLGMS